MNNPNQFTVPPKKCPRCGDTIPVAGDAVIKDGRKIILRTSRLICECYRTGTPRPRVRSFRKGEDHEKQESFLSDCPSIQI